MPGCPYAFHRAACIYHLFCFSTNSDQQFEEWKTHRGGVPLPDIPTLLLSVKLVLPVTVSRTVCGWRCAADDVQRGIWCGGAAGTVCWLITCEMSTVMAHTENIDHRRAQRRQRTGTPHDGKCAPTKINTWGFVNAPGMLMVFFFWEVRLERDVHYEARRAWRDITPANTLLWRDASSKNILKEFHFIQQDLNWFLLFYWMLCNMKQNSYCVEVD